MDEKHEINHIPLSQSRTKYSYFITFLVCCFILVLAGSTGLSQTISPKHVLILFEGSDVPSNYGRGDARQLAMLLGHFNVEYKFEALDSYTSGDINKYDLSFFIGFNRLYVPPERFLRDVYSTKKQFVWMNTGFEYFSKSFDLQKQFGIRFEKFDTTSHFDIVKSGGKTFTKG